MQASVTSGQLRRFHSSAILWLGARVSSLRSAQLLVSLANVYGVSVQGREGSRANGFYGLGIADGGSWCRDWQLCDCLLVQFTHSRVRSRMQSSHDLVQTESAEKAGPEAHAPVMG